MEKVYFSNFSKCGNLDNAIAISRTVPKFFKGERIREFAPPMAMIQRLKNNDSGQWQWFMEQYSKQIYMLPNLEELYKQSIDKILLCHCSAESFCHRILLAKIFEIEFGAEVEEVGGWKIPFNKPFEKIDKFVDFEFQDKTGKWYSTAGKYLELMELQKQGII